MSFPPKTELQLEGWKLDWFDLGLLEEGFAKLDENWSPMHVSVKDRFATKKLIDVKRVSSIRSLFRRAGCDPTRYRPSSEALLRRVLKGQNLPRIHPFVDLNNLLSMELLAPCCVLDLGDIEPPFVFRAGTQGERMMSMRGDIDLRGKPLLADSQGPFGTPITDSERVRVASSTHRTWLVTYLPSQGDGGEESLDVLAGLLEKIPVARIEGHVTLG